MKQGNRCGKLTVVEENGFVTVGRARKKRKTWLCKCDCGNVLTVIENSLLSGNTKSCGCLRAESLRRNLFVDIVGQRFGRLVAIGWIGQKDKHQVWNCRCDCGNMVEVRANNLKSGTTRSCGCYFKERVTKHGLASSRGYMTHLRRDPARRLRHRISCAVRKAFNVRSKQKSGSIFKYLPYTLDELKRHIESLWEPWMNWDNYGGNLSDPRKTWHIDHVIPQINFCFKNMSDPEFVACWALSNLRPMEKLANRIKGFEI